MACLCLEPGKGARSPTPPPPNPQPYASAFFSPQTRREGPRRFRPEASRAEPAAVLPDQLREAGSRRAMAVPPPGRGGPGRGLGGLRAGSLRDCGHPARLDAQGKAPWLRLYFLKTGTPLSPLTAVPLISEGKGNTSFL